MDFTIEVPLRTNLDLETVMGSVSVEGVEGELEVESGRDSSLSMPLRVTLNEATRELLKGEARIRLQDQPFQILRLLLARAGDVVTRDEFRARLWPAGTFVDFEHSLNAAIKRLRAVLGDDAKSPRFIETLPRIGYRWIAIQLPRPARPCKGIEVVWT